MSAGPHKLLILGASSWLGYLIARKFSQVCDCDIAGTSRDGSVIEPREIKILEAKNRKEYGALLTSYQPTLIINLLRGEAEGDFDIHRAVTDYSEASSAYYVYFSSVLALDGYQNQDLIDELPANSVSPYGIFKARCEDHLAASEAKHLILRFASVQGWAPHKVTRNELFLRKVSAGQTVTVDTGILQNRLFSNDLIDMCAALIEIGAEGIVHLGTTDSSSEIDFLRCVAEAFGWNPDLVVEGEPRNVNLVAKPGRVFELIGDGFRRLESDTIESLLRDDGLSGYINQNKDEQVEVR